MIDFSVAFKHPYMGFSCFACKSGIQVSIGRGGAWAVGIGPTFEEAWAKALINGGITKLPRVEPSNPRRSLDDLL